MCKEHKVIGKQNNLQRKYDQLLSPKYCIILYPLYRRVSVKYKPKQHYEYHVFIKVSDFIIDWVQYLFQWQISEHLP